MKYKVTQMTADTAHVEIPWEQMRTIWFALREYEDNLLKSLTEAVHADSPEDLMFLGEQLSKCGKLRYEMLTDPTAVEDIKGENVAWLVRKHMEI
jgi:hypothetical protein